MMPSYYICKHIEAFAKANYCRSCNLMMCDACAVAHNSHLPSVVHPTSSSDFEVKKIKEVMLTEEAWQELVRYNRERSGIAEDRVHKLEAALRKIRVDCFDDSEWAQIIDSALSGKP